MPTKSSKISLKCFVEYALSQTQVFEWHKAPSEGAQAYIVKSLKTCLMRVVHPSLLMTISSKKFKKEIVLERRRVGRDIISTYLMDRLNTFWLMFLV